jgi:hypothetical protein
VDGTLGGIELSARFEQVEHRPDGLATKRFARLLVIAAPPARWVTMSARATKGVKFST